MRNFLMSAMALTAVLVIPGVASANDVADRNQAISICRAEVQAQAGADANVRLDQARVRPRAVRVDLDVGAMARSRTSVATLSAATSN